MVVAVVVTSVIQSRSVQNIPNLENIGEFLRIYERFYHKTLNMFNSLLIGAGNALV